MQIQVEFKGTKYDLPETGLADMVAFERHYELPSTVLSEGGNQRVEWMVFLVFRGLRKLGVIAKDAPFDDDFIEAIEDFEVVGDEEPTEADPTAPAAALG